MISDYLQVEQSIKGSSSNLDPRSKLASTLIIVVGVSLSIDARQVLFFAILIIPMLFLYRPGFKLVRRLILFVPIITFVSIMLLFLIKNDVTLQLFHLRRTYTPRDFIILNALRFSISVTHSTMLLESVNQRSDLIDALASFYIVKSLVSILILINRMVDRIQNDYTKMIDSSKSKGSKFLTGFRGIFFRFRILGRLLARVGEYSDTLSDTLTARGFSSKTYTPTIPNWSSEGLSVLIIISSLSLMIISFPLWLL